MNRVETILAAYRSADEAERLYLFLSHRDLRTFFMDMDGPRAHELQEDRPTRSDKSWINRLFQYGLAFFRP